MDKRLTVTLIVVAVLYAFNSWTQASATAKAFATTVALVVLIVWLLVVSGVVPWPGRL